MPSKIILIHFCLLPSSAFPAFTCLQPQNCWGSVCQQTVTASTTIWQSATWRALWEILRTNLIKWTGKTWHLLNATFSSKSKLITRKKTGGGPFHLPRGSGSCLLSRILYKLGPRARSIAVMAPVKSEWSMLFGASYQPIQTDVKLCESVSLMGQNIKRLLPSH